MEAMSEMDSDQPSGTVVQVFQKGYMIGDRVLRPALVAVAKAGGGRGAAGGERPVESKGN